MDFPLSFHSLCLMLKWLCFIYLMKHYVNRPRWFTFWKIWTHFNMVIYIMFCSKWKSPLKLSCFVRWGVHRVGCELSPCTMRCMCWLQHTHLWYPLSDLFLWSILYGSFFFLLPPKHPVDSAESSKGPKLNYSVNLVHNWHSRYIPVIQDSTINTMSTFLLM